MAGFSFMFLLLFMSSIPMPSISKSIRDKATSIRIRKPIVIIPGVMGNQLEARLSKESSSHIYCAKVKNSWYRLWLNLEDIFPFSQNCFKDNIRLHYNATSDQYYNTEGVSIRAYQFGNTTGMESLDPRLKSADYLNVLVERLVEKFGYKRGVDLRGAPYDWRLGPVQLIQSQYYNNLQTLIENTYSSQNTTKVSLIVHSLGSLVSHYFLTSFVTETWKDKYIDQYITMGGVWAGSAKVLHALISGDSDEIFKFSRRLKLRPIERSFPSDYWLIPVPLHDNITTPLVTTPYNNYTDHDMEALIHDLNYPNGTLMYMGVVNARPHPLKSPNVTTHCIFGSGLQTESSFYFKEAKKFPNGKPIIEYGNGDGTVGAASLQVCGEWASIATNSQPIKLYELKGVEHFSMVYEEQVLTIIEKLVT